MIPLSNLKRAVDEGLAYIRTLPDVKEAEVFIASNGSLFTRLNYTSHIPSNGLEEPKSLESYGVGLRVAFQSSDGVKTGSGSEGSNISIEGVKRALEKARRGAIRDTEFVSLPKPTTEKRTLTHYHDPSIMRIKDGDLVDAGWLALEGALDVFNSSEDLLSIAGSPEGLNALGLIVGGDVTILQERIAVASTHMPTTQTDESTMIMSFLTAMVESKSSKGSGWSVDTHLTGFSHAPGADAARGAIRSMEGVRVEDGEYRVVFGRQAITDILHNLIVPSLQLGLFYASASPFLGKLSKQVMSDNVNIYDDGASPFLAGSKGITCEGLPTGRTELVKNGILVGLLSDYYETQRVFMDPKAVEKLGVDPKSRASAFVPRSGFRFGRGGGRHFDHSPRTSGSNVVIETTQKRTLDHLLREVGDGLYIGRIWYTYPINGITAGDFTCTVVGDSYIIKDGKLAQPVKPNTIRINDNIHNIFNNVIGGTSELKGTLVWAADQIVYTPEIAVSKVAVKEIAEYMETVY